MITVKLRNVLSSLTPAEQKIADYILLHPESVVNMTVKQLSEKCDTAASAVIRLCKSLGLEGYSAMKIALAGELGKLDGAYTVRIPTAVQGDDAQAVFGRVFNTGITTLQNTMDMLDFSTVEALTERILKAKRICVFGVGTSSVVALDASYRLAQLGLQAYAYTDILYMNVTAMNMTSDDVALFISHSGTTKAVVNAMRHAKVAGAVTGTVTSFTTGILYRECDFSLSVFADAENYPIEAVSARMAHMCVVDALTMTLASKKYNSIEQYIAIRNKALEEIRY